jgi:hypothetical protein
MPLGNIGSTGKHVRQDQRTGRRAKAWRLTPPEAKASSVGTDL